MSTSIDLKELAVMVIVALIMYLLTDKVPFFIAGIITGSSLQHGPGTVGSEATMATAAAAMAASAAAITSAGKNIAGASQALTSAISEASNNVSSGSDIISQMMNTNVLNNNSNDNSSSSPLGDAMGFSNDTTTTSSSDNSSSSSSSSSGFGSSISKAGKVAADTAANLVKGGWDVAKSTTNDAISETIGGKMAASIRGDESSDNFSGDNLSASNNKDTSLDEESEVAAFRDKNT